MSAARVERLPLSQSLSSTTYLGMLWGRCLSVAVTGVDRAFQVWCGLCGHTHAYHFEPTRTSLHCLNCGHQTPGWTFSTGGDAASHRVSAGPRVHRRQPVKMRIAA